ncbi:MAG: polysaccharide deacetylase family protein [Fusicatenibacter sp.]
MDRESLRKKRRRMRRKRILKNAARISVSVVVGLLLITGVWQLLSPRMEKKGASSVKGGVVETIQAAAPEKEDGSGQAGVVRLTSVVPENETPGWQYDATGWWYATSQETYYSNGWIEIDGSEYHFNRYGYIDTGWKAIGGKGYFFDEKGVYQPDRDASMMIAMTFDDGPSSYTSELLDVLEETGAKATFFMQGCNIEQYGVDNIPRMASLGCDIGNHSYDHPNMLEISQESVNAQFTKTDQLIAQYNNGQPASVIRFPYGNYNDELLQIAARPCFMWDVDTLDWKTRDVQSNISAVLDHVEPGDIVLMHDIYQATVESCKTIIPELISRGYELVTVRTLAAANGIELQNGTSYYNFRTQIQQEE